MPNNIVDPNAVDTVVWCSVHGDFHHAMYAFTYTDGCAPVDWEEAN